MREKVELGAVAVFAIALWSLGGTRAPPGTAPIGFVLASCCPKKEGLRNILVAP